MDSAKFKKLEEYVAHLVGQAETEEKESNYAEAIAKYLKTVDVLLVMADAAPNYPAWLQCTNKAETFQKKIKTLIALAAVKQEKEEARRVSQPTSGQLQTAPNTSPA